MRIVGASFSRWGTVLLLGAMWLVPGCGESTQTMPNQTLGGPQVVAAEDAVDVPDHPIAARFWAQVDTATATVSYYPLHDGNIIYPSEVQSDLRYAYGSNTATQGTCTPGPCKTAAGQLRLYTDQTKVTYVNGTGQCYSNGAGCTTPSGVCGAAHTFCAPLEIISDYTFGNTVGALPDVVVQLGNAAGTSNPVTGCVDNGTYGLCKNIGANKVDNSTYSNLTSSISGNGSSSYPCSYCYGNTNVSMPSGYVGFGSALISGLNTTLQTFYTDTLGLVLTNDTNVGLTITVRYSSPTMNTPGSRIVLRTSSGVIKAAGSCATVGSDLIDVQGGGFGPASQCLAGAVDALPASCPASSTTAASGYSMQFAYADGSYHAATPKLWSDTLVRATVPASAVGGQVKVVTPSGTNLSNDSFTICSAPNSWRKLTSTLTAVQPAAGAFGSTIVVVGGRDDPTTSGGSSGTTYLFSLPSTATGGGSVATSAHSLNTPRWGSAYTTVAGALYVIGGTTDGSTCQADTEELTAAAGAWSVLAPQLPVGLCQAAAVTLGNYIVVSGGSAQPYATAADFFADNSGQVYVLDTTNLPAGWQTFTVGPNIDPSDRFNQASAQAGAVTILAGGVDFNDNPLGDVSKLTGGPTPTFTALAALPTTVSAPAAASASTFFYVYGGGDAAEADVANGNTNLYKTSNTVPGAWTTLTPTGSTPAARFGHVFVTATPSYMGATAKIYAIGGANSGAAVSEIDEYTP